MIYYLKGIVTNIDKNNIVVNVHDVGYSLIVAKPSCFLLNKEELIYTTQIFKENEQYLIGFKSLEEKDLFNLLSKVKGLGPKGIINILSQAEVEHIKQALVEKNVLFFKHINGVGNNLANQIILDTKNKVEKLDAIYPIYIINTLKALGFKQLEIETSIKGVDFSNISEEEGIKLALSKMNKKYYEKKKWIKN